MTAKTVKNTIQEYIYRGAILAGVVAIIGMVWGMSVDIKVLQYNSVQTNKNSEKAVEISTRNNYILNRKADDSTNKVQHYQLLNKMDCLQRDFDRMPRKLYGGGSRPDIKPNIVKSNY